MPPSKKAKAPAVPAAASCDGAAPTSVLVARCSRSELEAFVLGTIEGNPVTHDMLRSVLTESKSMLRIGPQTIPGGRSREGTGLFDLLDDHLLVVIILFAPL